MIGIRFFQHSNEFARFSRGGFFISHFILNFFPELKVESWGCSPRQIQSAVQAASLNAQFWALESPLLCFRGQMMETDPSSTNWTLGWDQKTLQEARSSIIAPQNNMELCAGAQALHGHASSSSSPPLFLSPQTSDRGCKTRRRNFFA